MQPSGSDGLKDLNCLRELCAAAAAAAATADRVSEWAKSVE